jgi:hypothetical protein
VLPFGEAEIKPADLIRVMPAEGTVTDFSPSYQPCEINPEILLGRIL